MRGETIDSRARRRADSILGMLADGANPFSVAGQKIRDMPGVWSFAIGKRHRLVVRRTQGGFQEVFFATHEEYNARLDRLR